MTRKVLIIVENLPVPFDGRVWKEAVALQRNGYSVSVLCPKGKGYARGHEVLAGVHIYRHPMPKEGNSPFGYLKEYVFALWWELLYAWFIFFTRGFHVIQACNPPDDIFLIAWPFKLLGVKFIFDHHDANPELYLSKYGRKDLLYKLQVLLEKVTYACSDVVMVTNNSYKDLAVIRGGLDPQNIFVVRNGPDLSVFKPVTSNPTRKHGKKYLVGYVGTMSVQEGLDLLIDVAARVRNMGRPDVHFTCVGGGPGLTGLRKMVADKGLEETITFTGRVSEEELLEILSTADVCVNPDKPCQMNDISTMIKIMEYMALSKPIVQFNLKEGKYSAQESALYVDPSGGVAEFASKILQLLDNPVEREHMGKRGRKRVEEKLAWDYSVANLLAAYGRAFEKGGARSTATNAAELRSPNCVLPEAERISRN